MINYLRWGALGGAIVFLMGSYAWLNLWAGVLSSAVVGVLWLFGEWRSWRWITDLGLGLLVFIVAIGGWLGLSMVGGLITVIFALVAWDLNYFNAYLKIADEVRDEALLIRLHIKRLANVAILGVLVGIVALIIKTNLTTPWAIFWGVLALLGLNGAISYLQQSL